MSVAVQDARIYLEHKMDHHALPNETVPIVELERFQEIAVNWIDQETVERHACEDFFHFDDACNEVRVQLFSLDRMLAHHWFIVWC